MLNNKIIKFIIRLIYYIGGMFLIAFGVRLAIRGGLGISPLSSISFSTFNVIKANGINFSLFGQNISAHGAESFSLQQLDSGISVGITLGMCATFIFFMFMLFQIILLRKEYKPINLLQIFVSTLFGYFVDLAGRVVAVIPGPASPNIPYYFSVIWFAASLMFIALGMSCYIATKLMPMPGDGLIHAIISKTGKPFHVIKTVTDCTWVISAILIIWIGTGTIYGIREGTIVSAVMVGVVMGWIRPVLNPVLRKCGLDVEIPVKKRISRKTHKG